jgi:hypothetical protein
MRDVGANFSILVTIFKFEIKESRVVRHLVLSDVSLQRARGTTRTSIFAVDGSSWQTEIRDLIKAQDKLSFKPAALLELGNQIPLFLLHSSFYFSPYRVFKMSPYI